MNEVWYATAPRGATTRTVIAPGPEPKEARTAGAQAMARLRPNSARTVMVSTTKSEGTGSGDVGPSMTSLPAGKPCALSAAHITASHDTVASGLTCPATQAAACARTDARAAGGREECSTATAASDPMTMRARPSTTRRAPARRRGLPGCGRSAGSGPALVRALTTGSSLAAARGLAPEPSHSVTSSSGTAPVMRWGLAASAAAPVRSALVPLARELFSGPGSLLAADVDGGIRRGGSAVRSPAARSCSRATASASSAFTAACMRWRNSGDSTGITGATGESGPAQAAPRMRWGSSVPRSLPAMRVKPL